MPERIITFRCELVEDMHTGSGVGRLKMVDDCHARDAQGRPVVWYSTLAGLLRDSADELQALGHSDATEERMKRLFGAEGHDARSALVVRSLHFSRSAPANEPTSDAAGERQIPQPATSTPATGTPLDASDLPTFLNVASTAREVHSRRPLDETLRTIEYSAAGLIADGELRFLGDEEDAKFLKLCLKRIVAIGSGKSRGAGRIRISLPDPPVSPSADKLKFPENLSKATRRLRLVLRNLEPLCFPATAFPGNILPTESFLPGQALRGAFLTALSQGAGTHIVSSNDPVESAAPATESAGIDPVAEFAIAENVQFTNGYFVSGTLLQECPADSLDTLTSIPLPLTAQEAKPTERSFSDQLPPWAQPSREPAYWLEKRDVEQDTLWAEQSEDNDSPENITSVKRAKDGADAQRQHIGTGLENTTSFKRVKSEDYLVTANGQPLRRVRPMVATLMRNRTPVARLDRTFDSRRREPDQGYSADDLNKAELFTESVLVEDQYFVADVVFKDAITAVSFAETAASLFVDDITQRAWLRLGRGGRPVVVQAFQWLPDDDAEKNEPTLDNHQNEIGETGTVEQVPHPTQEEHGESAKPFRGFSLTLTSDLISRTPTLNFHTTLDAKVLVELAETVADASLIQVDDKASVSETRTVHGFNTAVGARRMPAVAIRRGSAFVVGPKSENPHAEAAVKKLRARLAELAATGQGLGERTEEGFGRFAIDHAAHCEDLQKAATEAFQKARKTTCNGGKAMVIARQQGDDATRSEDRAIIRRGAREAVIEKVLAAVDAMNLEKLLSSEDRKRLPGRTQWQCLRHEVEAAWTVAQIQQTLAKIKAHSTTLSGRMWASAVGTGQALSTELASRCENAGHEFAAQRTFLIYLCRWVVAKLAEEAREQQHKADRRR